jgi:hypothetical protein
MDQTIAYESAVAPEARAPRPLWVYAVVAAYVLVVGGLVLLALALPLLDRDSAYPAVAAVLTVLVVCELAMLFVPVRFASRRPVTRRALWIPLLGSATLAALLGLGGALAISEYINLSNRFMWTVFAVGGIVWLAWTCTFWLMSLDRGPDSVASKLHRWLLAGSVLELLIAVPTHLVVRRRTECCAGLATGLGICAGVAVMLLAFGPSVGFLYYRRWKQVRRRER